MNFVEMSEAETISYSMEEGEDLDLLGEDVHVDSLTPPPSSVPPPPPPSRGRTRHRPYPRRGKGVHLGGGEGGPAPGKGGGGHPPARGGGNTPRRCGGGAPDSNIQR